MFENIPIRQTNHQQRRSTGGVFRSNGAGLWLWSGGPSMTVPGHLTPGPPPPQPQESQPSPRQTAEWNGDERNFRRMLKTFETAWEGERVSSGSEVGSWLSVWGTFIKLFSLS